MTTKNEYPETGELMPAIQNSGYISSVVAALKEKDRPQQEVVCARCTAGLWFTTPAEVKCFCLKTRSLSWQTHKPNPITQCDGLTDQIQE